MVRCGFVARDDVGHPRFNEPLKLVEDHREVALLRYEVPAVRRGNGAGLLKLVLRVRAVVGAGPLFGAGVESEVPSPLAPRTPLRSAT